MLATALQSLHFRIFRDEYGNLFKDIDKLLPELAEYSTFVNLSKIECSQEINKLHLQTKGRHHGATAAYWLVYIDLVNGNFLLCRACKSSDFDLFICALTLNSNFFFLSLTNQIMQDAWFDTCKTY